MTTGRLIATVLLATLGSPTLAASDLLLDGSEFQVNTYTTYGQFGDPARLVARAPDGSFVVVWSSFFQDGNGLGIFGQRYDGTGAADGTEFQVNTYTTNDQYRPAVSTAADGSFVVVWTSSGQDGSSDSIHGQRFDSTGAADGTEFQVNTYTTSSQGYPVVSAAADGSFVVVWHSYGGQDGSATSVHGQRYDSAGAADGTEFQVNTYTTSYQYNPAVSAAADGSFVVVWESYGQDGSTSSVQGQRYDSSGAADGTEFQVNSYTTFGQERPAASATADGSFVVVWQSEDADGDGDSVRGQRYDDAGATLGTEFQVNTYTTNSQGNASVSVAGDGSFIVSWSSFGQDGDDASVHAQRFDGAGAADGTEFQVNTYTTGYQGYTTSVAVDAAGDFVVVWESFDQDGFDGGMFAQRLCQDADGNAVCDTTEACAASPLTGCLTGAKASFQVKDNADDAKDQIKWKLSKGDAFAQMDLGDPTMTRSYSLCVYDTVGDTPALRSALRVAPSTLWVTKDPKGFQYKDKPGTSDGVTKAKLKTGAATKSQAQVQGKGTNIPMPAPVSPTEFFGQDTKVIVQLVNNQTATCWTSEFTTATKNDGVQFKAKAP